MNDDFREFEQMKSEGVSPELAFIYSEKVSLDPLAQIRMLRSVYGLSLVRAKEISVTADGHSKSLNEHQAKLIPALKEILDDE